MAVEWARDYVMGVTNQKMMEASERAKGSSSEEAAAARRERAHISAEQAELSRAFALIAKKMRELGIPDIWPTPIERGQAAQTRDSRNNGVDAAETTLVTPRIVWESPAGLNGSSSSKAPEAPEPSLFQE